MSLHFSLLAFFRKGFFFLLLFLPFCSVQAGFFDDIFSGKPSTHTLDNLFDDVEENTTLPHGDFGSELLPQGIRVTLAIFSILFTMAMMWSGILMVIHYGDEEMITTARKTFAYSMAGAVISGVSYAIISGVTHLSFNAS